MYLCMKIVIVGIIEAYHFFFNHVQNFVQRPDIKIDSICKGNYWGSSVWISTQQFSY